MTWACTSVERRKIKNKAFGKHLFTNNSNIILVPSKWGYSLGDPFGKSGLAHHKRQIAKNNH